MYYELRVMPTFSKYAWLYSFTPLGGLSTRQYIGTGKQPSCGTKANDAPTTYPATPFNKESASKTKRTAKCRWKFDSRLWLTSLHCLVQLPTSACILCVTQTSQNLTSGGGGRGGGSALSATKVRGCCPLCPSSPTPLILTRFPHMCRPMLFVFLNTAQR